MEKLLLAGVTSDDRRRHFCWKRQASVVRAAAASSGVWDFFEARIVPFHTNYYFLVHACLCSVA
jgi:hypothetical protein